MREAGHQPRTFAVGFPEREFDETQHAATVARLFRTDHTRIELHESDLLNEVPAALRAMDQPTGDGINSYVISRCVRNRGITVALSGLGGDELFGGYPSFSRLTRTADISRIWGRSPAAVRGQAAAAVRSVGSSVSSSKTAALLETDGSLASMFPLMRQVLSVDQRSELLAQEVLDRVDRSDPYTRLLADAYADAPAAGLFARISFAEARTYMHDVLLRDTDQMSMAHGLEVRVPLLDHCLAEYVMGLSESVKEAAGTPKRLLLESLSTALPASVRRPKRGFVLPLDPWMRAELRPFCEHHLGTDGLSRRAILNADAVQSVWQSFIANDGTVSWSRPWALVALNAWLESTGIAA
jgi:asparagine synthase (glutamine-hydrolysing)